nr:GNAT family protein [uncultured Sellimonas sp.]
MRVPEMEIYAREKKIALRNAGEQDAQLLLDYMKKTSEETRFLVREPEEFTMTEEQEAEFIKHINDSETDLMLLAFLDGVFIGNSSFSGMNRMRYRHRASMGIALYQKYTGMGIGRAMIEKLLEIARETGYEQMELEVVADNKRAVHLYESIGFQIYGTFPDNMKYADGTYADAYWMMKKL